MHRALFDAHKKARGAFLPYDGVVGVGFGPKLRRGRVVSKEAIIVLVARKPPPAD